jgi:hypothetical protein
MKKTILALAVMLTVGLTSAFANKSEDINKGAISSFKSEFISARDVSWKQEKDFAKVTFTLNDQVMFAYYSNESGELLAIVRNILSYQLPINLFTTLRKEYNDHWISSLFEVAKEDHTAYYVTLENSDETVVLKAIGANEWAVYKRTKKS